MPDVHALLSASSSKQWLHCPPSVRLQEGFPNESSVYAAEGTFAHEVCEYKVRKYLHERVKRPQSEEYDTEEIEQMCGLQVSAAMPTQVYRVVPVLSSSFPTTSATATRPPSMSCR